jgi:hypothetical protein
MPVATWYKKRLEQVMGGPGDEGDVDVGTPERLSACVVNNPPKPDHHHLVSTLPAIHPRCGPIHSGKRTAGPAVGAALAASGPPLYRRANTDARANRLTTAKLRTKCHGRSWGDRSLPS